jgi:hypothetical protein
VIGRSSGGTFHWLDRRQALVFNGTGLRGLLLAWVTDVAGILLPPPEGSDFWREIDLGDGSTVESFRLRVGWPPAKVKASIDLWGKTYPKVELRSFTHLYNCVGMVFASRRAWIESTDLERVLKADGYRQLGGPGEVVRGDLVLYRGLSDKEYSHVAVVLARYVVEEENELGIMALSKWGQEGEYIHKAEQVPPHCGAPREYWTERVIPS